MNFQKAFEQWVSRPRVVIINVDVLGGLDTGVEIIEQESSGDGIDVSKDFLTQDILDDVSTENVSFFS